MEGTLNRPFPWVGMVAMILPLLLIGPWVAPAVGQSNGCCPAPSPCGQTIVCAQGNGPSDNRSIEDLVLRTSAEELFALYRRSEIGTIPHGFLPGEVIVFPRSAWQRLAFPISRFLWQGKILRENGTASNMVLGGLRAVPARYHLGKSWLDGRPSLIIDYAGRSLLFPWVRDEMREIRPNLYLGIVYRRTPGTPVAAKFYLLQGPGIPTSW